MSVGLYIGLYLSVGLYIAVFCSANYFTQDLPHVNQIMQIEVYSTSTYEFRRTIRIDHLSDGKDTTLTSCVKKNCLYVSEWWRNTIFRIDLTDGDEIEPWQVESPRGLSVNIACNVR